MSLNRSEDRRLKATLLRAVAVELDRSELSLPTRLQLLGRADRRCPDRESSKRIWKPAVLIGVLYVLGGPIWAGNLASGEDTPARTMSAPSAVTAILSAEPGVKKQSRKGSMDRTISDISNRPSDELASRLFLDYLRTLISMR
jgi:hypothetical protein